jgi:hypothetical protein
MLCFGIEIRVERCLGTEKAIGPTCALKDDFAVGYPIARFIVNYIRLAELSWTPT